MDLQENSSCLIDCCCRCDEGLGMEPGAFFGWLFLTVFVVGLILIVVEKINERGQ